MTLPFRNRLFLLFTLFLTSKALALPLPPIDPARYSAPVRVACVGDSITQGPDPDHAYPAQLQELLGDDWQVKNFGVSGRTMLRQGDNPYWNEKAFRDAQAFNPDAVIIMLGTNDTKPLNWAHKQDFARDTSDLVHTFQQLPAHPQIYLCRPTPVPVPGNYGINEAGIQEEIKIIDRLVQELRIGTVDMHATLADQPVLLPDRVHPNAVGLGKMAAAAYAVLTGSKPGVDMVRLNSLFRSHAVLQRNLPMPVWGTAVSGTPVTVQFAGQKISTVARDGAWRVQFAPLAMSDQPQALVISGPSNTITRRDILVGDVWIASGQSNMERELGPRGGQGDLLNWREEVARAKYPLIRHFYVPQKSSDKLLTDVHGDWAVCSPETAAKFTAVGYYFARDLFQSIHVPIGVIHTSWGGTTAEVWTSKEALQAVPAFKDAGDPTQQEADWFLKNDPGSAAGRGWEAPDFSPADWKSGRMPQMLDQMGLGNSYNGVVWFRKEFTLPAASAGQEAILHLGALDDLDTTWVNGRLVGNGTDWQSARDYKIPAGTLRSGKNVIAVRLVNVGGNGGWLGNADALKLEFPGSPTAALALAGEWQFQPSADFHKGPAWVATRPKWSFPTVPSSLYHSMLAPLIPFPIRGVIWYQGENNAEHGIEYRSLFPALIQDWRTRWKLGDFPFLYVQIAPFETMTPEIREAQFLTLARSPNTAMTVTTDCGEAHNIHPTNKEPVGRRLSLAARALAYGEKIEYSGPLYQSMSISGNRIVLKFTHVGTGLLAKGGALKGFTVAGDDRKFVQATAEIRGDTVEVSSQQVAAPKAVRYGWANVPDVNLFNKEGLPASPFRTDVE